MQPEATEKSYWHGEKYVPLTLKITSTSIGKMDLTASFQTLIYLISGMVCQINQNDGLKLCGWVILTKLDHVAHQTESWCFPLFLSAVDSACMFLSCCHGLCFCFETWEPLTSFSCDMPFGQLRSQMLCSTIEHDSTGHKWWIMGT